MRSSVTSRKQIDGEPNQCTNQRFSPSSVIDAKALLVRRALDNAFAQHNHNSHAPSIRDTKIRQFLTEKPKGPSVLVSQGEKNPEGSVITIFFKRQAVVRNECCRYKFFHRCVSLRHQHHTRPEVPHRVYSKHLENKHRQRIQFAYYENKRNREQYPRLAHFVFSNGTLMYGGGAQCAFDV